MDPRGPSEVVISLLLLKTLTTASFLSILGQIVLKIFFEYQIILKDLKIHYVKLM